MIPLLFLLCGLAADPTPGCRCAERALESYFDDADEVFVATLSEVTPHGEDQRRLHFQRVGEAYRGAGPGSPRLPYVSSTSSAACGIEARPGAVYVVFAQRDTEAGVAWVTTCNGTRILRDGTRSGEGFQGVPPRFVVSRLDALAGDEALRRLAAEFPDAADPGNESLVGLLDVSAFSHALAVPLFGSPDRTDPPVGAVDGYGALEHRESGYEVRAAVVFARVEGWSKVRRADGAFAWLPPEASGTWWPLEDLLPGRLAYLTPAWNRWIWPDPGAGIPSRIERGSALATREQPARITGSTRVGGTLWFEVEILRSNPCEGGGADVRIRGWVPAYGESGEPAAWFHSRGC